MRTKLWATMGVALAIGGIVSGVSIRPLSLQELCAGAEDIVFAQVQSVESYWVEQRIETRVTLRPHETWKGAAAQSVEVMVPGGTVGNITMRCSEAPTFRQGADVICFLRAREGVRQVYGWFRGQYTVVGGQVREMQNMSLATLRANVQEKLATLATNPAPTKGAPR